LQSANPAVHTTLQLPLEQIANPFAYGPHAIEQLPQWLGSVPRFASQPLDGSRSQSANPARHVNPQTDPEHVGLEFGGVGQARAHAPQFAGSVDVSTSQPSVTTPLQSECGGRHASPHTPTWQLGFALGSAGQTVEQRPQLWTSSERFTSQPLAGLPSQSA
jgi:hypothetical protein